MSAGPIALKPVESRRPFGRLLVGPPSYWLIVIWPSKTSRSWWFRATRLNCLAARPARSVRRCARTRVCGQRRIAPLVRYAGAGNRLSCLARARREACGAARAPEFVGSVALLRSCATRERASDWSLARARRAVHAVLGHGCLGRGGEPKTSTRASKCRPEASVKYARPGALPRGGSKPRSTSSAGLALFLHRAIGERDRDPKQIAPSRAVVLQCKQPRPSNAITRWRRCSNCGGISWPSCAAKIFALAMCPSASTSTAKMNGRCVPVGKLCQIGSAPVAGGIARANAPGKLRTPGGNPSDPNAPVVAGVFAS